MASSVVPGFRYCDPRAAIDWHGTDAEYGGCHLTCRGPEGFVRSVGIHDHWAGASLR